VTTSLQAITSFYCHSKHFRAKQGSEVILKNVKNKSITNSLLNILKFEFPYANHDFIPHIIQYLIIGYFECQASDF